MVAMPSARARVGVKCARSTGVPSTTSVPASARSAPVMIRINVDLPAPFSPTSACTSPGARSNETPFNALTPAKDFRIDVAVSSTGSAGSRSEPRSQRGARWRLPPVRALVGNALEVSALPERLEWIERQAVGFPPLAHRRPHVGGERVLQARLRPDDVGRTLCVDHPFEVDERGPGHERLRGDDRLDHRLDLALEVVALVDHVRDLGRAARLPLEEPDLVEDAE